MTNDAQRAVERSVTLNASPDVVWKALTDARELTRWFPLDADVQPGPGGMIHMRWGEAYDDTSRIQVWEPGRHLRIGFPTEGPAPVVTDYYLEAQGGSTVLRVVTSGFGEGDDWEQFYDGVSAGWDFELRSLKHYLERHRGEDRQVAWVTAPYPDGDRAAAWAAVTGADGFFGAAGLGALREGGSLAARTRDGTELTGEVLIYRPPRILVARIENWNDALFRLELEGHKGVWLWFATWGVTPEKIGAVEERWRKELPVVVG